MSLINDSVRNANDRHKHWVPLFVVLSLFFVTYLWTDWIIKYPPPGLDTLSNIKIVGRMVDADGHIITSSWMHSDSKMGVYGQRKLLFLLTAIGFLLSYYLPLRYKKPPLVFLTFIGVTILLGSTALILFLSWHLMAYLNFHAPPVEKRSTRISIFLITVAVWLSLWELWEINATVVAVCSMLTVPLGYIFYQKKYQPFLKSKAQGSIRTATAHSSLIFIALGLIWNGLSGGDEIMAPVGWLLFFWQWERVVIYSLDLKDGTAPADLPLLEYLALFFTPATFSNFHWNSRIPLGYHYLNQRYFSRDKNKIVLAGVSLIFLSVYYFAFRVILLKFLRVVIELETGIRFLASESQYYQLLTLMDDGFNPGLSTTWVVLFYEFVSFLLLWSGVSHLKVGLWRLFGYDVDPYINKVYLSTNLVELWKRYSFHYREFLVRAFYYPVFLRLSMKNLKLRIFIATFMAAGFGNIVYHIMYKSLNEGVTLENFSGQLATIPYYLLLGGAIAMTQVFLLRRTKHAHWKWGYGLGRDVLSVIGVIAFFILIRPFHHIPEENSIFDALRICLQALGISP